MLLLLKNDGSMMPYTRIRLFPPFSWHAWRPVAIFAANQKSWLVADGGASPAKTPLLACRSAVNSSRRNKCRRPSHRPAILDPRGRRSHGGEARGERRPSEQRRRDSRATRGAGCAPAARGARGRHGERGAIPDGVGGGAVGAKRRGAAFSGADADRGTSPARSLRVGAHRHALDSCCRDRSVSTASKTRRSVDP